MIIQNKHITKSIIRIKGRFFGLFLMLLIVLMFIQFNTLKAQVISNNGAVISITNGTIVQTDSVQNTVGTLTNDGTVNLTGTFINAGTTSGNGAFNLSGDWTNTGTFGAGTSVVQFNGNSIQTITSPGGESFYHLVINNSGIAANNRIVLSNDVEITDTFTFSRGNVETGINKLYLSNQSELSLQYTLFSGSRVIGKFERGISTAANYLFPVGSAANYNPLNLTLNNVPTAGSVLSEFVAVDPGDDGLPIPDAGFLDPADSVEIYQAYGDGYWSLTSYNGFSSSDYNINLDGTGFLSNIFDITRIIKRPAAGDWLVDGTHNDGIGTIAYRNNLTADILGGLGNHYGFGHCRPRIQVHPKDTAVCDGESASFTVTASGRPVLTYQWQVDQGSGWTDISNTGVYSGATASTLSLSSTNLTMNGYQYRVRVGHKHGNYNVSYSALLTVNPIPVATATPNRDTLCNNSATHIVLTSSVPGSTFALEVLNSATTNIIGATTTLDGDSIKHTLFNPAIAYDSVIYRVTPIGPNSTYCVGYADTIIIWVEPTPRVIPVIVLDTICNDNFTQITLTTPTILTNGAVTFDYTSVADIGLTGNSSGLTNLNDGDIIADSLHNSTSLSALPQIVRYSITPRTLTTGCANGPVITDSITVHPTADTYFDIANTDDSVSCFGYSDAYAQIVAENGVNIFTYEWDDPLSQTTSKATGLSQGTYPITVTDNQGCIKLDTFIVSQPDLLFTPVDSISDVSCFGAEDGFIRIAPQGGNGGYNYSWANGATTDSINGLSGDLYYVTVMDRKGCIRDTVILIDEPGEASASISKQNVTCFGDNNGWAEVVAAGATGFLWDTGEITPRIDNLAPKWYSVTVFTSGACTVDKSIEITEPAVLESTVVSTNISCAGDLDGTINLTYTGGNVGYLYTFAWSTLGGSGLVIDAEDQTGLSGGEYYVTVTDTFGCDVLDTTVVNEPETFLSSMNINNVTCFGDQDGSAELTVVGGNGGYSYAWSNSETTSSIVNIGAGEYTVIIKDIKDCEIYDTANVTEPDLLETILSNTDITCYGYADGTAKLDILGGNGGFIIDWSNGANTDSIYGLSTGTYNVTVSDINNCTTNNFIEIVQPGQIESNLLSENLTCYEFNNGQIIVSPSGGILPYSYSWSHNSLSTGRIANNLTAGNYSVSIVDNNNCLETASVDITQPDPMIADILKNDISCFGMNNGYISLSVTGGTPNYAYNWFKQNNQTYENTGASADLLSEGFYNINISDIHSCKIDTLIEIVEPEKLIIDAITRKPTCPDIRDGSIELNIEGGIEPYFVYWDNGRSEENLYDMRSGIFDLIINDNNLCEIDTSFTIRSIRDFCIDIPSAFSPNEDNINDKWEIDMRELYPYAEVEVFNRWGKKIFFSKGYEESQYWDGTYNGSELPMDTYFYIIYLRNGSNRISGTITLLR